MDPDNPVVKLCVAGMQAEGEARLDDAHQLFLQAWAAQQNDFEACIAAHFLARHQNPAEMLRWNQVALQHAQASDDARVANFYPSLYLNLGWSHETIGNLAEASHYYTQATTKLNCLPTDDPYSDVVRRGVAAGQTRIAQAEQAQQA
ncbi:MAG: hypothetical protein NT075_22350 [Chloroflexi bacterium]|nr:hypothetical protein [Chloroflexota bacterium]